MDSTKVAPTQKPFTQMIRAMHAQCQLSITIAAELTGISPGYLCDLLKGRRSLIYLFHLKRLCIYVWRLDRQKSLELFAARLALVSSQFALWPPEFYWRLADYPDLASLAKACHLSKSYVARVLRCECRPTYAAFRAIASALGYRTVDPAENSKNSLLVFSNKRPLCPSSSGRKSNQGTPLNRQSLVRHFMLMATTRLELVTKGL